MIKCTEQEFTISPGTQIETILKVLLKIITLMVQQFMFGKKGYLMTRHGKTVFANQ